MFVFFDNNAYYTVLRNNILLETLDISQLFTNGGVIVDRIKLWNLIRKLHVVNINNYLLYFLNTYSSYTSWLAHYIILFCNNMQGKGL